MGRGDGVDETHEGGRRETGARAADEDEDDEPHRGRGRRDPDTAQRGGGPGGQHGRAGRRSETRAATVAASEYDANCAAAAQPTTGARAGRSVTRRGAKRPTPKRAMPYVEAMSRVPASATAMLLAGERGSVCAAATITTVLP